MRRVSGYNLDEFVRNGKFNLVKLVVGSEGTLATVRQAKVRIEPRPPATALCVVHFADIVESIRASEIILPFNPAAIELIDDMIINLARGSLELSRLMGFIQGQPAGVLIVEFYGENEADLRSKIDELEAALKRQKSGYAYVRAFDAAEQNNIWKVRKAGLGLLLGMKGERKPIAFVEDCAVEPSKLPEFFVRFRDVIHKYGTSAGYYGHASVGCLHIRPLINTKDARDIRIMKEMTDEIADLVMEFGGGMSGEHGDGLARSHLNEKLFGPRLYKAFRDVKLAFDPEYRMNPGKIVDAPPMTENLRYGSSYRTLTINTRYDLSSSATAPAYAARRTKEPCARHTWSRWKTNIRPAGAPISCAKSFPGSCLRRSFRDRNSTRRSISAWNAKAARPNVLRTWTWPS
jgi:FAD/FMN-containing dehydrogenase